MIKRNIIVIVLFIFSICIFASCGKIQNDKNRISSNTQSVNDILQKQMASEDGNTITESKVNESETTSELTTTENATTSTTTEVLNITEALDTTSEEPLGEADPTVDIDLTVLSSSMIYSQVYDMMSTPDSYLGKKIKIKGSYLPMYYDGNGCYYHYVIINDALACCQNGMEFIWDNNSHLYPDGYPKKDDIIEVKGEFKNYIEDNYVYYYIDTKEITVLDE